MACVLSRAGTLIAERRKRMPRRTVVVCVDDLTGEEVPESEVTDRMLRFGYDEWTVTLTAGSEAKIREMLAPITREAPHKDHTPKWVREREENGDASAPTVTVVTSDNATVRAWWRNLTPAQIRTLGLKEPKGRTGRIPEDVMSAFIAAHQPAPAQFSE